MERKRGTDYCGQLEAGVQELSSAQLAWISDPGLICQRYYDNNQAEAGSTKERAGIVSLQAVPRNGGNLLQRRKEAKIRTLRARMDYNRTVRGQDSGY